MSRGPTTGHLSVTRSGLEPLTPCLRDTFSAEPVQQCQLEGSDSGYRLRQAQRRGDSLESQLPDLDDVCKRCGRDGD